MGARVIEILDSELNTFDNVYYSYIQHCIPESYSFPKQCLCATVGSGVFFDEEGIARAVMESRGATETYVTGMNMQNRPRLSGSEDIGLTGQMLGDGSGDLSWLVGVYASNSPMLSNRDEPCMGADGRYDKYGYIQLINPDVERKDNWFSVVKAGFENLSDEGICIIVNDHYDDFYQRELIDELVVQDVARVVCRENLKFSSQAQWDSHYVVCLAKPESDF